MLDVLEGLGLHGLDIRTHEDGDALTFGVRRWDPVGLEHCAYVVSVDGMGLRTAFHGRGPDVAELEAAVAEAVSGKPSPSGDSAYVALSAFGLIPSGRRTAGLETGDLAVGLAQALERDHPALDRSRRMETVAAIQRRLLDMGLHRIVDGIGPDRMALQANRAGNLLSALDMDLRCLRMEASLARSLVAAIGAYPWIAPYVARVGGRVPAGATPHDTAMSILGVYGIAPVPARMTLHRLSDGETASKIGAAALCLVGRVPRDWIPGSDDGAGWLAMSRLAGPVLTASRLTNSPAHLLVASAKGRWPAFAARLAQAAGTDLRTTPCLDCADTYKGLEAAAEDLADILSDIGETLVAPMLSHVAGSEVSRSEADVKDVSRALLFAGRGLPRILELSALWHRDGGVRVPGRETGTRTWDAVLPPFGHGDVRLAPLTSKAALADEGARGADASGRPGLSHCVATHWDACAGGRARIMGVVRASDGARLSTLEVGFRPGRGPVVNQHRGRSNQDPPPEAEEAVSAYMRGILDGTIEYDPAPLVEDRRRAGGGDLAVRCGYDWRDPDRLASALVAWERYLTRPMRGLSPDGLLSTLGRMPLVEGVDGEAGPAPGGP